MGKCAKPVCNFFFKKRFSNVFLRGQLQIKTFLQISNFWSVEWVCFGMMKQTIEVCVSLCMSMF